MTISRHPENLTQTIEWLDIATLRPHPRNGRHRPAELAHLRQRSREYAELDG